MLKKREDQERPHRACLGVAKDFRASKNEVLTLNVSITPKPVLQTILLTLLLLIGISLSLQGQFYKQLKGDPFERNKNVHSGNQVRSTFFNYGLIGRENAAEDFGGEWPINSGHFYVGDISIMVGAEIQFDDSTKITPVTVSDGPRGNNEEDPLDPNIFWGWEPLPGFANPDTDVVAMSHRFSTWPSSWPDRENDAQDPGWPGQWNGFFGKDQFNADQESFWIMDDSRDQEFIRNPGFYPDSTDAERGGLGLISNVRGLQWSQTLAQNTIFWLYDITNVGTTNYNKAVFGMIVGTTIGGDGDTNDDNSLFNAENNLTYSWDFDNVGSSGWSPVAYLGYAFLDSPGNSLNGFDDDGDAADGAGSVITEALLQPRVISAGDNVVVINYNDPNFPREVISFPAGGLTITSGNVTVPINPGDLIKELPFNNIDDNLNGLIDENTELPNDGVDNNGNGLVDEENPHIGLFYFDYLNGATGNPLIDESRDDGLDNDNDWSLSFDDVGLDGKASTLDFGEGDGTPTSGFQPWGPGGELVDTGLPGEPNIDKTDIDEGDQIGLTSFFFFNPFNIVKLRNDDQLWNKLRPGFFNEGVQNVDGDFIYGTAYFPLRVGQTERISLAFFFGNNLNEIFRTKKTVQQIYNNDYNFAKAPQLPTLRAFAGDGVVNLYWDTNSEESFDKLSQVAAGDAFDFEGYKIYRATFPEFNETGSVTNVFGSRVADVPIAQFDLLNDISGFFPEIDQDLGTTFYFGENTGLVHAFTDSTVTNGLTYFYAVTAFDRGINALIIDDSTGLEEKLILQPAETSKFATLSQDGTFDLAQNVIMVRPEAPAAGHIPAQISNIGQTSGDGTGEIMAQVVDPLKVKDQHQYEITFQDNINNLGGGRFSRSTSGFSVFDITNGARDTVVANNPNVDIDAVVVDGIQLHIINGGTKIGEVWEPRPTLAEELVWSDSSRNILKPEIWGRLSSGLDQGSAYPANYQLQIGEIGVDTSAGFPMITLPAFNIPVNYRIKNISEGHFVSFNHVDLFPAGGLDPPEDRGILDEADIVVMYEEINGVFKKTFQIKIEIDSLKETPIPGDILNLTLRAKPFLEFDTFRFSTLAAKENIAAAKDEMNNIKVVPNPYIATAIWEPRNNFSNGRGERAIHFTHLPKDCTIRIYNLRGELVATIEHNSHITNGTADWDLLSRDQLDIAYGVYIYHINAPGIGEKIGKFAIIK